jgi:thymidylate synthase ThyX
VLSRFFTNLDGPVFAVVNLPEVVKGALFARYSRSHKSVRRLFLDEFATLPELGADAPAAAADPVVNQRRAETLYDRVFTEYGDDSVAQLGGAHLAVEQASNVLTKILERGRLASYLEQSTRYIFYDRPLGDRYRYTVPAEVAASPHRATFVATMEALFTTYARVVQRLVSYYGALYPRQDGDSEFVWTSSIRARACDDARGLLPAATTSNVGIFASGQAYEAMLLRMRAHPLAEARHVADLMLTELRKVIPSFMRRVDLPERGGAWSAYLARTGENMQRIANGIAADPEERPEVTLVSWNPEAETEIVAAALYPHTALPDDQLLRLAREMDSAQRAEVLRAYAGDRTNRRHKPGRGMERSDYRFDILCDYGIFRDLQRHRMLSIDWQRLAPRHGYVMPDAVDDVGEAGAWEEAMARTAALHDPIATDLGPEVAQYAVPFAYKIRFYLHLNAREAFHLLELRTGRGGHPGYRRVCQEMHRLIREQAGHALLADAMTYVDYQDYDLARLESERRAEARRAAADVTPAEG